MECGELMGVYFNPEKNSFVCDRNQEIYIDKTGILEFLNERLQTNGNCILVSRARGFGKTHIAGMIAAYYSHGSDSTKLFDGTKISLNANYKKYMNKYNVIHLDAAALWDEYKEDIIEKIIENLFIEFRDNFGDEINYKFSISYTIMDIYQKTGIPFVIIIDEWDSVIRNSENEELIDRYLRLLHSFFKTMESRSFLALGYLTGILPMKRMNDESGLNNFEEFSMFDSYKITEYHGFTENEVKTLCEEYDMDYEAIKQWYGGYCIDCNQVMYTPYSIVTALEQRKAGFYWENIPSMERILSYISMNYKGVKDDILKLLSGEKNLYEYGNISE